MDPAPPTVSFSQLNQVGNQLTRQYLDNRFHANNTDCGPEFSDYTSAFQQPNRLVPKQGFKFSDEDPRYRTVPEHHTSLRKRKLFVSDKNKKTSTELPETYSVELNFDTKNIRYIRPVQVQVTYTATATAIVNAFLHFPDFDNAELTSSGKEYHAYFPVIQGSAGVSVLFNHVFATNYITEFKKLNNVRNKLRVQVFKEISDGTIVPFTELTAFAVELELDYVDSTFRNDFEVQQNR